MYKVVVVGMGKRGKHHALAFKNNPRFELAGICTRDAGKLTRAHRLRARGRVDAAHLLALG